MSPDRSRLAVDKPLSIAILAMGGQGGGVLADWIVALGEANGWIVQATSVPGVAQRTGATLYYIEMIQEKPGLTPVLALMPTPGDVDVVMAAELMEAGRSVLRGLVTPDRTMLIASTHRSYAVIEKQKPGNGIADSAIVLAAAGFAARRTLAFDMERIALREGSVISAPMFGALAAAKSLPFAREAFEAAIRAGGKAAANSLAAFRAAFDQAAALQDSPRPPAPAISMESMPATTGHDVLDQLLARIRGEFPQVAHPMLFAGVKALTDYQDPAYADEYLTLMARLLAADSAQAGDARNFAFTVTAAKYVALSMAYDDTIRVADLKTRASRFSRVRREAGGAADQPLHITEYIHPRMEEFCSLLPGRLGAVLETTPWLYRLLDRRINRGRRIRTDTLCGFLSLYGVSALRRWRRGTLRHAREMAHRDDWLATALATLKKNYDLAVELLVCRRLVKGYSDTHARGMAKFDRVLGGAPMLVERADGATLLRQLLEAALADEEGTALDDALKAIALLQDRY